MYNLLKQVHDYIIGFFFADFLNFRMSACPFKWKKQLSKAALKWLTHKLWLWKEWKSDI